jgi:hypothetical protein
MIARSLAGRARRKVTLLIKPAKSPGSGR